VRSIDEMTMTGENLSVSATLSTKNPTQLDLGSKLGLHSERSAADHLNHSMAK
jgi:hypothetical protein